MTGIILFRAQPFHNGHLAQIKRAYEDMKRFGGDLYVIVGSADKSGTKRNPIPIDVRIDLIRNSINDNYEWVDASHIHVVPLDDLKDETNNTHSWGTYLCDAMCRITGDIDFIFYYSDKPEIALSWFNDATRDYILFKFLPRVEDGIEATLVRKYLADYHAVSRYALKEMLPPYVYSRLDELHKYIINAK